jgi:LuxR family glucitol operon transcriptional activator
MAKEEALLLIKNEGDRLGLNLEALAENEDNFRRFYEATGGAPLAIRWAIGQIKQRGQSIEGVLASLYGAHSDIFELIFQRAWSLLSEPAKKVLTIMPVFAASASKPAIEAASDVHHWELDEALGQLVELWLLEASEQLDEVKRRYQLHPLTRFYAQSRLSETSEMERRARLWLVEFFENFAKERGGDQWSWERYDEIEEEKDNIFELIEWCFETGEVLPGMKLTKSVTFFMDLRGYLYEALFLGRKAVEIARQEGKTEYLAWLLIKGIGWKEIHTGGHLERGEALIREGLEIYESLKDSKGIRGALHNLGMGLIFKKDFEGARQCFEKGMNLAKSPNDELAMVTLKRGLAILAFYEDNLMEAKEGLEAIIPILRQRDELTLPSTLGKLAEVYLGLKNYNAAFNIGLEGLELAKKMKKRHTAAWILQDLAHIEVERRNYQAALSYAQQALEFYERSGLFRKEIEETKTLIHQLQEKLTHSRKGKNQ